jgi:hypothetical protein
MLPRLPNTDKIKKAQTVQFSGMNKNPGAVDGTLWDTINMGSDKMPCLSPRKRRWQVGQFADCCGMYPYNGLYLVLGTDIQKDGVSIGTASNTERKMFAAMNKQIIMYPDKLIIDDEYEGESDWEPGIHVENIRVYITGNKLQVEEPGSGFNFAALGILPGDTISVSVEHYSIYDVTAEVLSVTASTLTFSDNTFNTTGYYYVTIDRDKGNTIQIRNFEAQFYNAQDNTSSQIISKDIIWSEKAVSVGDTVTISGSSIPGNNKNAVITGIGSRDSLAPHTLFFAPDEFTETGMEYETLTLTKSYTPPADRVNSMDVVLTNLSVVFEDQGSLVGNTIRLISGSWDSRLRVGDAVKIERTGYDYEPMIIREIDGGSLRFDEYSFVTGSTETINVSRTVPDLDGVFVHENRLWGYKGNTIYASKLGDPLNFDVFDGLTNDSWQWEMDGTGDIIGGIVYQGYPTFFKEDNVVRIYGDRPSQYRSMDVSAIGIHPGCGKSLAIAGDKLLYVSRNGLATFSGGYSQDIHEPFGEIKITQAVAGSDGRRYFLSAYFSGQWALFVYDTVWSCWFREDNGEISDFACDRGNLYFLRWRSGAQYLLVDGHAPTPPRAAAREPELSSEVVFNDFTGNYWTAGRGYGNPSRKGTSKIQLRVTMEAGSTLDVFISFEGGDEILVKQLEAGTGKHSYYLPIIPRRSDNYKIILRGYGDWTLNSLVREEYSGSDIH